jgi:protein-S-isoprenylcysteine O-methyltransferase Ste14
MVHSRRSDVALKGAAARIAYALLFCAVLPGLLVLWARSTADIITLPAYGNTALGVALCGTGLTLLAGGMAALWTRGGGLPMNAFPPPRLVASGIYRLVPHPIYVGFSMACFGAAMAARSASGLWLVSPVVALACAALVWGYEIPDLERRFGPEALKQLRRLPVSVETRPDALDALRFYLLAVIPWAALYEIGATLGVPSHAINTAFRWEARLPIWPWAELLYASVYLSVLAVPILVRTRRDLRELMIRLWISMAVIFPVYFCVPTFTPWRDLAGRSITIRLLMVERAIDMPAEALPSYHVVWAILMGEAMAASRRIKWPFRVWAALVSMSCVMTGAHAIADVIAGFVAAIALLHYREIWCGMRSLTERIANSWREWRFGPVRIINHGFYAGAATFAGLAIAGWLVGPRHAPIVAATGLAGLVGAGLWAQWVEGSPRLLRPFGYYGGVFSVMAVSAAGPLFGTDPWMMLAAYSVAGPWIQAIGRLRCLVQGCCHGRVAEPAIGIRYVHPRSRVCRLAELRDVPVHATPLYSILWNVLIALVMVRLWVTASPWSLIGGVYLVLTGIGRFSEEAWRGEPQTAVLAGLRLYQWIAIGTVLAGAAITATVRSGSAGPPEFAPVELAIAAILGVLAALALGVDLPESNRRFARLA